MFIVNPVAGRGRVERAQAVLHAARGGEGADALEVAFTERPGDAVRLAQDAAAAEYDPVVAVGGDGTVHEVVNGLLRFRGSIPSLAVIPTGTGNDFARSVGIPTSVREALDLVVGSAGALRPIDTARVGNRYFVGVAGAGFDARVAKAVNAAPNRMKVGALPFVYYTLREIVRNRNPELTVDLDGGARVLTQRSLLVAVANCRFSGGGMQLAPDAEPDDGLLDVCLIGDASATEVVRLLPSVFSGGHVRHPKVSIQRAATVRVSGPAGVEAQADGELIGGLPLEISVVPRGLRVVTAAG